MRSTYHIITDTFCLAFISFIFAFSLCSYAYTFFSVLFYLNLLFINNDNNGKKKIVYVAFSTLHIFQLSDHIKHRHLAFTLTPL